MMITNDNGFAFNKLTI